MTIGFTSGADSINVIAADRGTPFFTSLAATGTIAQSQTGKRNPDSMATIYANILFLGNTFTIVSSDTKTCMC